MNYTERPPTPTEYPGASTAAVAIAIGKVERPTPDLAEAMGRGYEPKDISLRGLFIFLGSNTTARTTSRASPSPSPGRRPTPRCSRRWSTRPRTGRTCT